MVQHPEAEAAVEVPACGGVGWRPGGRWLSKSIQPAGASDGGKEVTKLGVAVADAFSVQKCAQM